MPFSIRLKIFLAGLWLSSIASAKTVLLHGLDGQPVPSYRQVVHTIEPGDTVISGRERIILDESPVNFGTDIFAKIKGEGFLVRFNSFYPPQGDDNVTQILNGERVLDTLEVEHSEIDKLRSKPGRFVIHRYYQEILPLEQYLAQRAAGKRNAALDLGLVEFARSTAPFYFIGDFGTNQIGFTDGKWRLLDWSDEHYFISPSENGHTWERGEFRENLDLFGQVENVINRARQDLDSNLGCIRSAVAVSSFQLL